MHRRRLQKVPPTMAFSLIQELVHRDGLRIALAGRDDVLLEPILQLLVRYIADPRFGDLAASVASVILGGFSLFSFFFHTFKLCSYMCIVSSFR